MAHEIELILLRQLAGYLTIPVLLADMERLVFYNEAAEAMLGRRFDEAGELPLTDISDIFWISSADGEPIPPQETPLGIALFQRRPAHDRVRFRGLDGVEHMVEATAFPIEGHGSRHLGAFVFFWENHR
jgi:PAS domain-containing protein